tara:strand:+ start:408 stop:1355 length:948 start_codon:yes stop_codon:yes gene_type:complete
MNLKKIKFPLDNYEILIEEISGLKLDEWISFWEKEREILSYVSEYYGYKCRDDWLWGVVLPLLYDVYNLKRSKKKRKVIGLSALPGTGKTTLGLLIEKLSLKMNIKVSVVSMDDFYLPFSEMNFAIKDNPWNVSRGFPGSHSTYLIEDRILEWKNTGIFNYPVFDKSLRNGLGDRSSWEIRFPDVLILEGWFLGVNQISSEEISKEKVKPCLYSNEVEYRLKIQKNLNEYFKVWQLIEKIWQIKPKEFSYMDDWKSDQENAMLKLKGNALVDEKLKNFLRMLNCSIPQESFNEINSRYLIILNKNRELISVDLNN